MTVRQFKSYNSDVCLTNVFSLRCVYIQIFDHTFRCTQVCMQICMFLCRCGTLCTFSVHFSLPPPVLQYLFCFFWAIPQLPSIYLLTKLPSFLHLSAGINLFLHFFAYVLQNWIFELGHVLYGHIGQYIEFLRCILRPKNQNRLGG